MIDSLQKGFTTGFNCGHMRCLLIVNVRILQKIGHAEYAML